MKSDHATRHESRSLPAVACSAPRPGSDCYSAPASNGLRQISDRELLKSTREAVQKERESTAVVLRHFLLVEERRLYALKHPSLFAWATEELGYSEGAAQRRIDAARLLRELPSLAEKIESGLLSLTNLSQAKSFFRQEKKAGKLLLPAEKAAVLTSLERKSSREALKHLVSLSSNPQWLAVKGTLRSLGQGQCEMRLIMTDELANDLTRIKALWAHALPDAAWPEIIARMAKIVLKNIDSLEKAKRAMLAKEKKAQKKVSVGKATQCRNGGAGGRSLAAGSESSLETSENRREEIDRETGEVQLCLPLPPAVGNTRSRAILAADNHEAWLRDQGQCAYLDEDGKRCPSRYALERDHRIAFAAGGGNDVGNIRLYCRLCRIRHKRHYAEFEIMPHRAS